MKLTGKCKEEFLDYLSENKKASIQVGVLRIHWPEYPKVYLNALIIEFFDSVGIYISNDPTEQNNEIYHRSVIYLVKTIRLGNSVDVLYSKTFKNKPEATSAAITKANEIFNLNNK